MKDQIADFERRFIEILARLNELKDLIPTYSKSKKIKEQLEEQDDKIIQIVHKLNGDFQVICKELLAFQESDKEHNYNKRLVISASRFFEITFPQVEYNLKILIKAMNDIHEGGVLDK